MHLFKIQRTLLTLALLGCIVQNITSFTVQRIGSRNAFPALTLSHAQRVSSIRYGIPNSSVLIDDVLRGNSTAASSIVGTLADVRGTETMEQYPRIEQSSSLDEIAPDKMLTSCTAASFEKVA